MALKIVNIVLNSIEISCLQQQATKWPGGYLVGGAAGVVELVPGDMCVV